MATYEKTSTPGCYRRGRVYYCSVTSGGITRKIAAGPTLTDAKKLKRKLESERDKGALVLPSRVVFMDWLLDEWLPTYQGRGAHVISPRTKSEYARDIRRWALPWFQRTRLNQVTRPVIKAFIAHLQRPETGLRDSTIRRICAPLRAALGDAADAGLIMSNPSAGVGVPTRLRIVEEDGQAVKALTRSELQRLIEAIDPRHRLLVEFVASTALRISEALAVRWRDLDLSGEPSVRVVRAVKRGQDERFGPPKSRAGRRTVPLPTSVAMALRLRRAESEWHEPDCLVFPTTTGTLASDSNLRRRYLGPAARAAGVGWASWHTLRHTAATLLFAEGRNVKQVQRFLGHSDPGFTLRTYIGLLDDDLGGPLDLDRALRSSPRWPTGDRLLPLDAGAVQAR